MLRVVALPAFTDNYIWVIFGDKNPTTDRHQVFVVDPGDAEVVSNALNEKPWDLAGILITHHHHDHTGGVISLKNTYKVPVYGPMNTNIEGIDFAVCEGDSISLGNGKLCLSILEVPGHTLDHIAYFHQDTDSSSLFCGDTVFSAGCGRMFEGTAEQFTTSFNKIKNLPKATAIYCSHEYTASNLNFARHVDFENADIQDYQDYVKQKRSLNKSTLPSTLELELKINPFLNCDTESMQLRIAELAGLARNTLINDPIETFAHMRKLKDNF